MRSALAVITVSFALAHAHAHAETISSPAQTLYQQDQADRKQLKSQPSEKQDWPALRARDQQRRETMLQLLREAKLHSSADYFAAAMVFQHGDSADDYRLAFSLATLAQTLDDAKPETRWLTAASWDRLLLKLGKPQWYGTQFERDAAGKLKLSPIDAAAVDDAERARLNVPPLAQAGAPASAK
ncbi:hypothetical protein [Chromobacterium sp. IIBBL 290-4]|uniref:hypothetical protein n=1 Tax=Chromobacterium sp. IIBBL 290-4 TaxID=2953890 RepID=UPI0020B851D6|nr:hypothetical protein [Chromobacterium sp. IIBBL 290-4]UTH75749.1 hypothetical protein NKT35_06520 [Chromobacterium sp. IIBBL 290-4]